MLWRIPFHALNTLSSKTIQDRSADFRRIAVIRDNPGVPAKVVFRNGWDIIEILKSTKRSGDNVKANMVGLEMPYLTATPMGPSAIKQFRALPWGIEHA
jgi:hypothetical protein